MLLVHPSGRVDPVVRWEGGRGSRRLLHDSGGGVCGIHHGAGALEPAVFRLSELYWGAVRARQSPAVFRTDSRRSPVTGLDRRRWESGEMEIPLLTSAGHRSWVRPTASSAVLKPGQGPGVRLRVVTADQHSDGELAPCSTAEHFCVCRRPQTQSSLRCDETGYLPTRVLRSHQGQPLLSE